MNESRRSGLASDQERNGRYGLLIPKRVRKDRLSMGLSASPVGFQAFPVMADLYQLQMPKQGALLLTPVVEVVVVTTGNARPIYMIRHYS